MTYIVYPIKIMLVINFIWPLEGLNTEGTVTFAWLTVLTVMISSAQVSLSSLFLVSYPGLSLEVRNENSTAADISKLFTNNWSSICLPQSVFCCYNQILGNGSFIHNTRLFGQRFQKLESLRSRGLIWRESLAGRDTLRCPEVSRGGREYDLLPGAQKRNKIKLASSVGPPSR